VNNGVVVTQGKARIVENENARFGANPIYWFLKVQWDREGEQGEEYWLLTDAERLRFEHRAATATGHVQGDAPRPILHPGRVWLPDPPEGHRGVLNRVQNSIDTFGTLDSYLAVRVLVKGSTERWWVLTDHDVARIRYRVFTNHEDIDREREGWLADLLD
jgi:hypothetical protein